MNALKAFDAAARCGGFTAAASELSVSPGAISRHVANLEAYFGELLFERHHNEIELTPAGKQYSARIRPALDVIEDASRRIIEGSNPRHVHVTSLPGIGRDWLLPRLTEFTRAHPRAEIELSTKMALMEEVNFDIEDVDIALHYNIIDMSSQYSYLLFETELQVVCSPALLERPSGIKYERDLLQHTLLYSLHGLTLWRQWFNAAGVDTQLSSRSLRFGDGSLAMQAAVSGLGVALGETAFIEGDMRAGRLVSPFPLKIRTGNKFFMSVNPARAEIPSVKAFRDWVLATALKSGATQL
ncbi:LysR substrate-binding domain-containing protein [Sphingobium xenophagum]|uniref:LysR substrate-binding domain-containing protein n=1 Tax=Sphingobium xenophagum TaxID=121428 RepID=UPI0003816708|nr:LysR substrate-binding domain-containing protein [Sphingobium xenophagum]